MAGSVGGVGPSMPIKGAGGDDVVALAQQLQQQINTFAQKLNRLGHNHSLSSDSSFQTEIAANIIQLQQTNAQALLIK